MNDLFRYFNKKLLYLAIGAFGIQFAVTLQMANMSSMFKFLGVSTHLLPYMWMVAPITGLFTQPILGLMSDQTVTRFGKRIPYIAFTGIFAALSLALLPFSTLAWLAFILFLILDVNINGCQETLRILTADIVNNVRKIHAFALQTTFAGLGSCIAAISPWLFHFNKNKISSISIPLHFKLAFILGGLVLLFCIFLTVSKIKESPIVKKTTTISKKKKKLGYILFRFFKKMYIAVKRTPKVIKSFYLVQLFAWFGIFTLWLYLSLAISQHMFKLPTAANVTSLSYIQKLDKGTLWSDIYQFVYQLVSIIFCLILIYTAKKKHYKKIFSFSLLIGAIGIASLTFIQQPNLGMISMVGIGIMWGSLMTMPYVIVTSQLPKEKTGVYLGIFNISITLPQIIIGLVLSPIIKFIFKNHAIYSLDLAAFFIFIAGIILLLQRNT